MKRSKKEVLDADFAAARAGVLDIAAFLDRVDRGEGEADFRYRALMEALPLLSASGAGAYGPFWKPFPTGMTPCRKPPPPRRPAEPPNFSK